MTKIPNFDTFMNPTLKALVELGGSGSNEEIFNKIIEDLKISDKQLEVLHKPDKSTQTEVEYRMVWTRTYLKKYGLIENSSRGIWALTLKGKQTPTVIPSEVVTFVRNQTPIKPSTPESPENNEENEISETWRIELMDCLLKMPPDAFERLIQRMLRESGFIQVDVTGRSGDGGIDGKGIMRIGGLMSFHVIFQCKRYKGNVTVSEVRDFRGAMVGRGDKGLFVTTGNFTKDALREATRDGAPAIDLIDGDNLVEKLKELNLGINTKMVEEISIDTNWFASI